MKTWTNWVGNQSFTPASVEAVSSEEDVQRIVARAAEMGTGVSTAGTGHSFTPIVETDGVLLDLEKLRGIVSVDAERLLVTAGPKTIIADFGEALWRQGLALSNQGDIDAQAIAGAIATATHGSGKKQPNFSAVMTGARIVDGHGSVIEVSDEQNSELLPALQTSIGVLGIMTQVTIKVAPAYALRARTDIMNYDEVM
ncbi:MAG TPA: FAD-binding protein, partial [Acidimicrobiia bacterium]|nr:FAD-binding protein [Acidimicrobiia bacterium]